MAIVDNKGPTGPQQAGVPPAGNASQPLQEQRPPAYGTYQSGPIPVQGNPAAQSHSTPRHYNAIIYPAEPTPWRFLKAFLVAALVWFLFTAFVQSVVHLAHWSHRHRHGVSYPIPAGITLDRCVSGGDWWSADLGYPGYPSYPSYPGYPPTGGTIVPPSSFPFSSKTTFDLPVDSEALFLLSRGPLSSGSVDIVASEEQSDVAKVYITVHYFRENIRDTAKACLVKRTKGEVGVGIFSPNLPRYPSRLQDRLYFEAVIVLPISADTSPLLIKKFETDVPNSPHRVMGLSDDVNFQSISLKGSNAPIHIQSLYAEVGDIATSNSPIEGSFNSSRSLILKTSNAHIKVDVGLTSKQDSSSPNLVIRTSNNVIDANVSLISESGKGGQFHVNGATSNGHLNIKFPTAPVDSTLRLDGKTSNSPATISLHPSYEGKFFLTTSNLAASVRENHDVEDPSGKERNRSVSYRYVSKTTLHGNAQWAGSKDLNGSVAVRTSNAPILLEL